MVVHVENEEEQTSTKEEAEKKNPKPINKRISGQEGKQRTDLFFINKALQKDLVWKWHRLSALENITFLIHSFDMHYEKDGNIKSKT